MSIPDTAFIHPFWKPDKMKLLTTTHALLLQAAKSLSVQFAAKNEEMERGEWPLADFEKKEQ